MGYDSLDKRAGIVRTAYVVIVIRKDMPGRAGEAVMLRGYNSSAVQWVTNYTPGV